MAQDSDKKVTAPGTQPPDHDDDNLHYYSGGEVKELAKTQVNRNIIGVYLIVIAICAVSVWYAGAIPGMAPFRPKDASHESLAQISADLAQHDAAAGTVSAIDLDRLPAPDGQTKTQAIAAGEDIYKQYCIGCHGPNQDGNGVNASSLNPKPRNLRDAAFMQSMSLQRINQSIHRGVPGTAMPHWEDTLNEVQIRDVIFYVWSLTTPKTTNAPAEPPAAAATPQNSAAASTTSTTAASAPGTNPPAPATTATTAPAVQGPAQGATTPAAPAAPGKP